MPMIDRKNWTLDKVFPWLLDIGGIIASIAGAKFNEFFTSFYLAKLPVGQHISPPDSIPANTTTFSTTDQLCENIKVIKLIPATSLSSAIYNVTTKQNAVPVTVLPNELGPVPGPSSACGAVGVASGHYEYKAYIDNILIVDTAFEMH